MTPEKIGKIAHTIKTQALENGVINFPREEFDGLLKWFQSSMKTYLEENILHALREPLKAWKTMRDLEQNLGEKIFVTIPPNASILDEVYLASLAEHFAGIIISRGIVATNFHCEFLSTSDPRFRSTIILHFKNASNAETIKHEKI